MKKLLILIVLSSTMIMCKAKKMNSENTTSTKVAKVEKEKNNIKELDIVGQFSTRPGNVAVDKNGRVFTTMHPLGKSKLQLIEVKGTTEFEPFPNMSYQKNGEKASNDKIDTPLGIRIDKNNKLWIIDMGQNLGKTRLFAFDIDTKKEVFRFDFPLEIAPKGSFIQDLAVDEKNGWVYLADISNPGILAVNINDKSVRRFGDKTHHSEDIDMVINGKIIEFGGAPARVAINPITLSEDRKTLYFGAMNGTKWYKIPTKLFREGKSDKEISEAIEIAGKKPISDGVATHKGKHYFSNLQDFGVDVLSENGELQPLIRSKKLDWTDNVAVRNEYIYVVVNQLYKTPAFTGKEDFGNPPYYIYKFKL